MGPYVNSGFRIKPERAGGWGCLAGWLIITVREGEARNRTVPIVFANKRPVLDNTNRNIENGINRNNLLR